MNGAKVKKKRSCLAMVAGEGNGEEDADIGNLEHSMN